VLGPDGDAAATYRGLQGAEGVVLDAAAVYVAESGARRVTRIDRRSGRSEAIASGLPFGFPRERAGRDRTCALIRAADGARVVSCDGDGSLRKIRQLGP
jgi:hypothetical protein